MAVVRHKRRGRRLRRGHLRQPHGLPFETAFPLLEDRTRQVWLSAGVPVPQNLVMVARKDCALVRLGADGMRAFTRADGLPDDRVLCTLQTRSGEIWFGTQGVWTAAAAAPTLPSARPGPARSPGSP